MQMIEFRGSHYPVDSDALQVVLNGCDDLRKTRPTCLCVDPPVPMYVSKYKGHHLVKRMPDTGHQHSPMCDSYEVPAVLSGSCELEGKAIVHDEESGTTTLKLAFALSKTGASHATVTDVAETDTAKVTRTRLTMRSLVDYLWSEAQFNRWHPGMEGRRNYAVLHKYVGRALAGVKSKKLLLAEAMYMPEPFFAINAQEIEMRARAALARCAYQRTGNQPMMLMFGLVKDFTPARSGAMLQIKHAPFVQFYIPHALVQRMDRLFESEHVLWRAHEDSNMMVIASIFQNAGGVYELQEVALMLVDRHWLPISGLSQMQMTGRLVAERRSFIRSLAFNGGQREVLADFLLTDCAPPCAVYMVPDGQDEDVRLPLIQECDDAGLGVAFVSQSHIGAAVLPPMRRV